MASNLMPIPASTGSLSAKKLTQKTLRREFAWRTEGMKFDMKIDTILLELEETQKLVVL